MTLLNTPLHEPDPEIATAVDAERTSPTSSRKPSSPRTTRKH